MTNFRASKIEIVFILNPKGEFVFQNSECNKFFDKYFSSSCKSTLDELVKDSANEFLVEFRKKHKISQQQCIETELQYSPEKNKGFNFLLLPTIDKLKTGGFTIVFGYPVRILSKSKNKKKQIFETDFKYYLSCNSKFEVQEFAINSKLPKISDSAKEKLLLKNLLPPDLFNHIVEMKNNNLGLGTIYSSQFDYKEDEKSVSIDIKQINTPDGLILFMEDLTHQNKMDSELRKYVEELHYNKIISEQYAKELSLVNKKLNESQEELRELNINKDKFFSIVAHDLRSPFSSLLGFSEFLAKEAATMNTDEIKEFSNSIYKTGRHLLSLLENLLQWSRIQLGRIEYTPINFDISDQIKEISTYYEHVASQKRITIDIKIPQKVLVFADKNMIETVLRNLLSNALKFTQLGGNISIEVKQRKKIIDVSIKDDGVGISEDNKSKLFKIESQLTTVGTNDEKGSGLGLLLCKDFITKNKGQIAIESELGKGTTFIISLPIKSGFTVQTDAEKEVQPQKTTRYKFSK